MSGLIQYAAPATEPLTLAEVRRHLRIDATDGEPAPFAPTVALAAPVAAGNVDNGAHRYLSTFVTADGETEAGVESASVTVSDKTVNGKIAVSDIQIGGSAVTARKLYRTKAGGSVFYYHSTISDNVTTSIVDNVADAALGAEAPTTNTTGDPALTLLIASVRRAAESATNQALITQTWDLYLDYFPCWEIQVPKAPLQSVDSISYLDNDGVLQVLSNTQYLVDAFSQPGRITPAFGTIWPVTRAQLNAVKIRFVCGQASAAALEPDIKAWMLLAIGTLYENRSSIVSDPGAVAEELPGEFVANLVRTHRVHTFF